MNTIENVWTAFVYHSEPELDYPYADARGTRQEMIDYARERAKERTVEFIAIHPVLSGWTNTESTDSLCVVGEYYPPQHAVELGAFYVMVDAAGYGAPDVLPFDDTPLPLSVEQAIDAAIAKHALTVEADCECDDDDDDDDDHYALAADAEEMESEIEAWRDFAVMVTGRPRAFVETALDARNWMN